MKIKNVNSIITVIVSLLIVVLLVIDGIQDDKLAKANKELRISTYCLGWLESVKATGYIQEDDVTLLQAFETDSANYVKTYMLE